jgi:hypothetical protein
MAGWTFRQIKFGGSYSMSSTPITEKGTGEEEGIAKLKANPEKYESVMFQNNLRGGAGYTLFLRGSGVSAKETPGGLFTLMVSSYQAFGPAKFTDAVSDTPCFRVYGGTEYDLKRIGRGDGICDVPGLKLLGDVDPADLVQGGVGDCWLISAISALSEFDAEIEKLFTYHNLEEGKFTVKLFDLPSGQWKEVGALGFFSIAASSHLPTTRTGCARACPHHVRR